MKPIIPFALIGALAAIGANAATTDPVGYTTTTISGAFNPTSPKNNVIAPDLEMPATFSGAVASIAGDVLTLTGAAFTPNDFDANGALSFGKAYTYFVETADGYWAQIETNGADSVTIEAGAGANFTTDDVVTIRAHVTISDYFGPANEAGLQPSAAGDTGEADNVILIDEVNGGTITVIASNALGGNWITDAFDDAATVPIYPDQGVQVLRRGEADLSLVFAGAVDTNGRQIGVSSGVQIRPYISPVDTTLTDLNLYTGDNATGVVPTASGDAGEADVVTVLVNGTTFNYFYATVDLGSGEGWYDDGLGFAGDVPLPAGAGLIINRANPTNSDPFVWVAPAPAVAP